MCARYEVFDEPEFLEDFFSAQNDIADPINFDIRPKTPAPVVLAANAPTARVLAMFRFGLLPHWSKEPRIKFATYNARLDDRREAGKNIWIYEKPTWRVPFRRQHCLVPIRNFSEPIYTGEYAGHWVRFLQFDSSKPLIAAGIWDSWSHPNQADSIYSFAMITDEPLTVASKTGHDRSPLLLELDAGLEWLSQRDIDPKESVEFLRRNRQDPLLPVEKSHAMKPGWEKRA